MSRARITRILMMLFAVMLTTVLAEAAQKKTNPPPAAKTTSAAKPAPTPKQAQPARGLPANAATKPVASVTNRPANVKTPVPPVKGSVKPPVVRPPVVKPPVVKPPVVKPPVVKPPVVKPPVVKPPLKPPVVRKLKSGREAKIGQDGSIRQVHDPKRNMTVEHGFRPGDRRIVTERNNRTLVSTGPGRGYVQRAYTHDRFNRPYVQRTYWVHGHAYAYAYRDHFYGDRHYYRYAPGYYYHPVFYGWAYHPWAAPINYNWGWGPAAPWFYGGYFAPAPYYPTASLWLADYLLAENLKLAWENQQAAQASGGSTQAAEQAAPSESGAPAATQLTADQIKQLVDTEVKRQLQAEQAEAQSTQAQPESDQTPPPVLDPKQFIFVVASNLGVSSADGQECELTPGDIITRIDKVPGPDGKMEVSVTSSKSNDCGVGSSPRVEVSDLQEMLNSFRQQLDAGLKTLADKSGTGGLPKAPDTQTAASVAPATSPDSGGDKELADQQKEATQLEAEVQQEVQTAPAAANQ